VLDGANRNEVLAMVLKRFRSGFTLVEVLVVVVVIAILAAVVLPKFVNSGLRGREAALRAELKLMRNAVEMFKNDTGAWPASLSALTATSAPATGLDDSGTSKSIVASHWKGPYLATINNDPVSGAAYNYGTTSPDVGKISSSATGNDSEGNPYSGY
jgi:general secretion pathway protein G